MMPILLTLFARLGLAERFRRPAAYMMAFVLFLAVVALLWARGSHYRHQRDTARMALKITASNYVTAAAQRKASDLANVQRVSVQATAIDLETVDDYQARIDQLRAAFAERVRIATAAYPGSAGRTDLPGVPQTADRIDEASHEAQFPAKDALIASEQAEQLVALQGWVTRVAAIDPNGE